MRNGKAPGLTKITVELMKGWCHRIEESREKGVIDEEAEWNWSQTIKIVQECFKTGITPTAFEVGTLVIIPKDDKGGVRGIGLLEIAHKLVSAIINRRMTEKIMFCDAIHGFRRKRGCFTAIGEVKLRIQQVACAGRTLYQVYLDLRKAYDSVNREGILALLEKYKVRIRIRTYIENV